MLHAVWHVVVFSSNDPVLVYDRPHAPQMVVQEIAGIVFFTQSANASHGKGSALECGLCPLQFITDASDIQVSVTPDVSRGDHFNPWGSAMSCNRYAVGLACGCSPFSVRCRVVRC